MSTKSSKKKKGSSSTTMDSNRQKMLKQKKSRQERSLTQNAKTNRSPKSPPKYSKSGTQGSSSLTYTDKAGHSKPIAMISSDRLARGLFQDQPVLCFKTNNSGHFEPHKVMLSRSRTGDGGVSQSMPISKPLQLSQYSTSSPSSPSHSSSTTSSKDGHELSSVTSHSSHSTHYIPKQQTFQLKRKRKNQGAIDSTRSGTSSATEDRSSNTRPNGSRPTFQFKIGMQVGVALGDCFLQLQKLENSMDHLRNASEDITDVFQCIEDQMQPQRGRGRKKSESDAAKTKDDAPKIPLEDVAVLNENLVKWHKDSSKRMRNVSQTVDTLQHKLEDLDEYHSQAQEHAIAQKSSDRSEIEKANATIRGLRKDLEAARKEIEDKKVEIQQIKSNVTEPSDLVQKKLEKLESKEKELDHDAEIIATQSEELRKESERLLTERDEVRKQKEQWQKMIDEVKDQKAKIEKRESELQTNHKKLLELHETLSEEKKKLHKKAKKIKAREKRLNALRAQRSAPSAYVPPQSNFNHMVPSSNGSDYAESELTYFSDGDTEIASVNSISDDESQDNYHKQQMQALQKQMNSHLGVPQHPY